MTLHGVHMGKNTHLVRDDQHRTLCNRVATKIKVYNAALDRMEWQERPHVPTDSGSICSVCQSVARKSHEQELNAQYGKVRTMQNAHQFEGVGTFDTLRMDL